MSPQDFGRATEARFLMDAHRDGLIVSRPFADAPSYDCIVDNGKRLFRVQIKGARATVLRNRPTYVLNINRIGRKRVKFDVLAAWLEGESRWVFLPAAVSRRRQIYITPTGRNARRGWEVFRRR